MRGARRAQVGVDARQQAGRASPTTDRARLLQARARERQRRALRQRLLLQGVEAAVAEALPPRTLGHRVARRAGAPGRLELPRRRRLDRRAHVVRARRRSRRASSAAAAARRPAPPPRAETRRSRRARGDDAARPPRPAALAPPRRRGATHRVAFGQRVGRVDDEAVAGWRRRRRPRSLSPRLRPSVTGLQVDVTGASTTATRVPSPRNSSTLVGTTSVALPASGSSTLT